MDLMKPFGDRVVQKSMCIDHCLRDYPKNVEVSFALPTKLT